MNMFGRPEDPITEAVDEIPYPHASGIVIAYPSFGDWFGLYDPHQSRGSQWDRDMFEDFRRSHERSVTHELHLISARSTGRAVLAEMNARPSHKVMILPFDFLLSNQWHVDTLAVTHPMNRRRGWSKEVPICGRTARGKPFCVAEAGSGTGTRVRIYFTPRRHHGDLERADEALLHELVHASRNVRGVRYQMPMNGGYGNQEEFLAVLIANMYRSEKKRQLFDYDGDSIDAASFLDSDLRPPPRTVLALLRSKQPTLFAALAKVQTPFNPIRQVDEESKALVRRIEQT